MLIERSTDKKILNHYYQLPGSQMVIVYGQKNMGKTSLVRAFAGNKPHSYYLARSCSSREQRFQWSRELRQEGEDILDYPEYKDIFPCLARDGEGRDSRKRVILLDEFHHMVKGDESFIGELFQYIRQGCSGAQALIILCTSAMGWVENIMVQKLGEAAFFLKGFLKVKELKFEELRCYFKDYSLEECVKVYAVLGGMPGLWNRFDGGRTVKENIIENILKPSGRLYQEIPLLTADELRETGVYNTILAALAGGCNKLNDIYLHTGFSRAKISVYLKNLMELELVEKVFSYETDGRANAQKGIYRIANPFVRFYFYFIYPYESSLAALPAEDFYSRYIEPKLAGFTEEAFKKACREHFEKLQDRRELPFSYESVGEWVGKAGILDIVARNMEGSSFIASCSYENKITYQNYEWLIFCAGKARIKPAYIYLYSLNGYDGQMEAAAKEDSRIILMDMGKE